MRVTKFAILLEMHELGTKDDGDEIFAAAHKFGLNGLFSRRALSLRAVEDLAKVDIRLPDLREEIAQCERGDECTIRMACVTLGLPEIEIGTANAKL